MHQHQPGYYYATVHGFKGNIAKILRLLAAGHCRAAVITRYGKPVAMVHSLEKPGERTGP